ncbi:MAG: aminopeptidase P family protein [Hyphomicrobiales bacterium]|nr:aminopeptidase P family protein [Hyphomicrobiales bacterium]
MQARFQNFSDPSSGSQGAKRLSILRRRMLEEDLDAWLVPHGDEHQNEYPPPHAWRLAWLTGFTGSAGYGIVTGDEAIVFVDGRYTSQVTRQIDTSQFGTSDLVKYPPHKWLENWISEKSEKDRRQDPEFRIGFDPWLTTLSAKKHFKKITKNHQVSFVATDNLIDRIWLDQPSPPVGPVSIQNQKYCGELAIEKIKSIKHQLTENGGDFCLLSDPASIAWLFNIRGHDTPHTPLALGYAVIHAKEYPQLFMDKQKMSREVEAYLTQLADLHPYSKIGGKLAKLANNVKIHADFSKTSVALGDIVNSNNGKLVNSTDPVVLPRAIKNASEIKGSRNAHLRDGVAVTKFLYWIDQQKPGSIDEITAVNQLELLRCTTAEKFQSELKDISFNTISGAGANGAVIHYRVTRKTNTLISNNSLYLVDSGGQYEDGTTDITRTIAVGTPPPLAVEDFTLVLKGHIAIALARFPEGTRGVDLDSFARASLWRHGRDFAHGTGHGIGSYLSVHEGPQSISRRSQVEIKPGMIISNEPGFYREGQWGIRIENLILVKEPNEIDGGNVPVMGFETLSLAPIDLRLINPDLMNKSELHWLNAYHGWVKRQLTPHLEENEAKWLETATTPLTHELPAASA